MKQASRTQVKQVALEHYHVSPDGVCKDDGGQKSHEMQSYVTQHAEFSSQKTKKYQMAQLLTSVTRWNIREKQEQREL